MKLLCVCQVWGKVRALQQQTSSSCERRTVGILGCMAERLKDRLLESALVQVVAGVDTVACSIHTMLHRYHCLRFF